MLGLFKKRRQEHRNPTLLEILARDWSVWIGRQRVYQAADGAVIASEGYCLQYVVGEAEIASDRATAVVTEPKWAARRASQLKETSQ